MAEKKKGKFFKEFLSDKKSVGAIAPSSKFLAKKMTDPIDFHEAKLIVEFGPGTGKITRALLDEMTSDCKLLAFEINDSFIDKLKEIKDDRLKIVNDSAQNIGAHMNGQKVDYVVSSLPLAVIPDDVKDEIVTEAMKYLKPEGQYIQFQYSLNDRKLLKDNFAEVKVDFAAINLPPAFVYKCKP